MNAYDAAETAYKNGYKQGFEDGADRKQEEILKRLEEISAGVKGLQRAVLSDVMELIKQRGF